MAKKKPRAIILATRTFKKEIKKLRKTFGSPQEYQNKLQNSLLYQSNDEIYAFSNYSIILEMEEARLRWFKPIKLVIREIKEI
ncbi:hypothetical protein A2645_01890 [Candidatus Nomurabacteria bacterium RIFCSPHIGHO2_01_FULL_39_9]|uniref:Uncharacterized protein n=1 Tax=Candidatus Nomurabacteria bacterium RIFCSPHIGHO2_01_FULL_39_9 TaxID=1801735 RepID=A0A1F6UX62_9BACT|nr:MAG: hypothetical protein A2645_01890 [Candidatus Nomurabacteria bacterium RIFCSPHIGHO2_01_FULL_39_9]